MIRMAIVEDDPTTRQQIQDYATRYFTENHQENSITLFADGMDIAEDYRPMWDIILLDIEMPHLGGMATAERIRQKDPAVVMIFITKMARYAIKGYEVDALDFVLKPVSYAQFAMKLHRALARVSQRTQHYLMLNIAGEQQRVATSEIQYIEVKGHWVYIHLPQKTLELGGSLQQMEQQLAGQPFVRSSNSYLVNLRQVEKVSRDSVLVQGESLPLSRGKRAEFLQRLADFMGGGQTI